MAEFLQANLHAVRFVYGLIFYTLCITIVLQTRHRSAYFLSKALLWLAAFAGTHAVADWGLVFIPIQEHVVGTAAQLLLLRSIGVVISFGFLMQFGLMLLLEHSRHRVWSSIVPSAATAVFIILLVWGTFGPPGSAWSAVDVKVFARYLMGGTASALSAWGLLTQVQVFRRDRLGEHARFLYGAAACFAVYGVLAGSVVPQQPYFPANVLNEQFFLQATGLPIEVARGLAMLGVTYFTVRLMGIFQVESQRRLQAVEQERALLRERERIARELHDGIMQTLYGTGLGLKQVTNLSCNESEQARGVLTEINQEIGRAIVQMRRFVLDLKEQGVSSCELAEDVQSFASQVSQVAGIRILFQSECPRDTQVNIPGGIREEVMGVVREGLSNVVRHSQAKEASVMVSVDDDTVLLRISDTGCGFDPDEEGRGQGLTAMQERVRALGGFMQVLSAAGAGTQLVAHLPVSGRLAARAKEVSA